MSVGKPKKQIYIRLVIAYQGGQKNHNEKTSAILFLPCFLLMTIT